MILGAGIARDSSKSSISVVIHTELVMSHLVLLGILHQVAFHSQPGVFRQEAENF